jgi:hypothetical protein
MKPSWTVALVAALLAFLFAGPALAKGEAPLKAQVQALFDQAAAGFMKKDVQAITATSVPQATLEFRDGRTLTLAQWAEGLAKDMQDWQGVSSKFVVRKAWALGKDQVGAVYTERHDFTLASDPGHKHGIAARFKAVLTRTPQGLRFLEFQEVEIRITRDGKAVHPQAAPR